MSLETIAKQLAKLIKENDKKTPKAYDTQATVTRIEGSTAWVHIAGGVDETPVKRTISCQAGDNVQVRVSGGRAWITGNATAPPTDDRQANIATEKAEKADKKVVIAQETADTAKKIAGNTNQYFWHTESGTDTGVHITEKPQEEFLDDPQNGGGNLLARSNGIAVRDGLTELATFGASGSQIGESGSAHSAIDTDGQRFYGADGSTLLANIGYGEVHGQTTHAPYYHFGDPLDISEVPAYDENTTYKQGSIISYNNKIYMLWGYPRTGESPDDTGWWQLCPGKYSFVEGVNCAVSDTGGHAEGKSTRVSGAYGHAEGENTLSNGGCSHAQNMGTIAQGNYQTAMGKWNVVDYGNLYGLIIGNGTADDARSNALTVDWSGNIVAAGNITSAISACGAAGTADVALSTSEKKITLSTSRGRIGPYLSNSNGGVKCGKDGYVEISGGIYFSSGFTNNDIVHTVVKKNSTQVINAAHRLPASYDYYSVPPLVCEVSAGDILYLYAYNQTGARGSVNATTESWLTVKYL